MGLSIVPDFSRGKESSIKAALSPVHPEREAFLQGGDRHENEGKDEHYRRHKGGVYPVNVLNAVKAVQEVCSIYCASANPVQVILAETEQGRGILGVVDGLRSKGIESEKDTASRKELLRKIGYKV